MEEKKLNKKTGNVNSDEQPQKYSYEELNQICGELYQQNQTLARQLRQMDMGNMFKRLDYLFLVVGNKDAFNSAFVDACIKEIEELLAPVDKEEKEETSQEN